MAASTSSSSCVVIAFDATKNLLEHELPEIINNVRARGDILRNGDTLVVLGILHKVTHPLGYKSKASSATFETSIRAAREETSRKVESYVDMLQQSAKDCKDEGVIIKVKIKAGVPVHNVILLEVISSKAAWLILHRKLKPDLMFYLKKIPCKIQLLQDSFLVEVLRRHTTTSDQDCGAKEQSSPQPNMQATGNCKNQWETSSPMKSSKNHLTSSSTPKVEHNKLPTSPLLIKESQIMNDLMQKPCSMPSMIPHENGNEDEELEKLKPMKWIYLGRLKELALGPKEQIGELHLFWPSQR